MTNKRYYNYLLNLFLAIICFTNVEAQVFDYKALDTLPELTLEQALKENPLTVYKLTLKKTKLVDLPEAILQFKNLQSLNISKNKLKHFPAMVFKFLYLQKLDVSDNKIVVIPSEIGNLVYLKEFIANQTEIATLPAEIGKLKELVYLDIWGTNVASFPEEIQQLNETLKEIDMRVIMMSDTENKKIKELLPTTKIHFSKSCNCGF
ncbi:MAG: leucine-rich repeat domain-containing protein [Bacteroidetes bacterium]|nr:leucine-rich repeat domain-containing protein [Bacteroidota bacterium]